MTTALLDHHAPAVRAGGWFAGLMARLCRPGVIAAPALPSAATVLFLGRDELLWVHMRPGREIRCVQGRLWLTFDGDPSDVVLDAGDTCHGRASARALIQALKPARFQVT